MRIISECFSKYIKSAIKFINFGNDKAAQNLSGIIDYHEVNDAARSLVGEVRRFECSDASSSLYATISALIDSVNNDSTSFDALSSIQFIDKRGVEGSNYLATAQYISDYCYSLNSLASLHIIGEKLANPVSLVIAIASCVVILAISIFIIKRNRVA